MSDRKDVDESAARTGGLIVCREHGVISFVSGDDLRAKEDVCDQCRIDALVAEVAALREALERSKAAFLAREDGLARTRRDLAEARALLARVTELLELRMKWRPSHAEAEAAKASRAFLRRDEGGAP